MLSPVMTEDLCTTWWE